MEPFRFDGVFFLHCYKGEDLERQWDEEAEANACEDEFLNQVSLQRVDSQLL